MTNKGKTAGHILIIGGLLSLVAALFLIGYNLYDEQRAGWEAERALAHLAQQARKYPSRPADQTGWSKTHGYIPNPNEEMPIIEIDGHNYIGILEIPSLQLSLPIMSEWSYSKLKIAPCRFDGSAYAGTLTIAGHNYRTHFGHDLAAGTRVEFSDVVGNVMSYEVVAIEILNPADLEGLLEDTWDLTLFTCTYGGEARIAVRCLQTGMAKSAQ